MIEPRDFSFIFSNLDIDKNIKISGNYDNDQVSAEYQTIRFNDGKVNGLDLIYKYNNKDNGESRIEYSPQQAKLSIPGLSLQQQSPFLISEKSGKVINSRIINANANFNHVNILNGFLELIREKKDNKKELIDILNKIFDEKIADIINSNNIIEVFVDKHQGAIPFSFLGGGMNRALALFLDIASDRKVLLIDEIENGLHHSKIKSILTHLFKNSIQRKIQLFITTHNKDVITTINDILKDEENKDIAKFFNYYRLFKNDQPTLYKSENFIASNETSMDIRG